MYLNLSAYSYNILSFYSNVSATINDTVFFSDCHWILFPVHENSIVVVFPLCKGNIQKIEITL